jgi:hypothetical protein
MTRAATIVPAETDLLCEGCGYTLNGLPESGNCPECGKPIAESIGSQRILPAWEVQSDRRSFWATTYQVTFHPTSFFRTLATRRNQQLALKFARLHWLIAALGFGLASLSHFVWYRRMYGRNSIPRFWAQALAPVFIYATYLILQLTTALAARLTHWEAAYRGLRLPLPVVRRGLYYHAAHYSPVALLAFVTIVGYVALASYQVLGVESAVYYLYILCAEVILAAAYLFKTYWIGMKNMMFANR